MEKEAKTIAQGGKKLKTECQKEAKMPGKRILGRGESQVQTSCMSGTKTTEQVVRDELREVEVQLWPHRS
jgi:hypothetical protein